MDSHAWDERYGATELVWSEGPNQFVAEIAGALPPGRALDLACGEGRNAIWLARQGWTVTGVDFSQVGLDKGRRLAEQAGVEVRWVHADLRSWQAPEPQDLVVLSYLQLPAPDMAAVVGHGAAALAPGGLMLLVGHARRNLTAGTGGPQDPAVLYEPDDVVPWCAGLTVERADHVVRVVGSDADRRQAVDTLVLARKPA